MKLKHTKVTAIKVKYKDLEEFIQKQYSTEYCFIRDYECRNDSTHELTIKKAELDGYEEKDLKQLRDGRSGDGTFFASTALIDLCNKDIVEEGTYIIEVSW